MRRIFRSLIFVCAFGLSACAGQPVLQLVPQGVAKGETVELFVATNRQKLTGAEQEARSETTRHFRLTARIPPDRETGEMELPVRRVDPDRHFLAESVVEMPSEQRFVGNVRRALANKPANERELALFVHGYNTNFAFGAMRVAQLQHDLEYPGVISHFSWPSAASVFGYGYDRDSALFSRDALESHMRALAGTGTPALLVAHSMGAQLSMEALRQIELQTPGWSDKHLSGIVLLSPDIDIDVFRSQVSAFKHLPQPFIIFVSNKDRALELSALITGESARLGNLRERARLAGLDVTLMDVSNFSSGLGHFDIGTSPSLIRILQQIPRVESAFSGDVAGSELLRFGAIVTVQNVTNIILLPVAALP